MFRNPVSFKQLHRLTMHQHAKNKIRERLVLTMQTLPVTEKVESLPRHLENKKSSWLHLFPFHFQLPIPVLGIMLALVLGTGTAFAAEQALPGETLYPVKIYVNEEVRAALALSPKQKAQWQFEVAERRAAEAQKIQAQGRLDAAMRHRLSNALKKNQATIESIKTTLEAQGNVNAAAALEVRLEQYRKIHANILNALNTFQDDGEKKDEETLQQRQQLYLNEQTEFDELKKRRANLLIEIQNDQTEIAERREEFLLEKEQQFEQIQERRHQFLIETKNKLSEQLQRRHEYLLMIKEALGIQSSSETTIEAQTEIRVDADTNMNTEVETEVDTAVDLQIQPQTTIDL